MTIKTLGYLGMGTGEHEPFDQVYPKGLFVRPKDIADGADIDALVVWGGEDISPTIYGDKVSAANGADARLSHRDIVEKAAVEECIKRDIPIIGVCRGAQLVCALAGGRLIQHVENHGRRHLLSTFDGRDDIVTSSVHHQMMYPFDVDHEMIAWAQKPRSRGCYIIGDDTSDPRMEDKVEPEIVWFPKIKALAIQGHPEFHSDPENDPFVQYCMQLVHKFILNDL